MFEISTGFGENRFMKTEYILSIDQGTTGSTVIIFDTEQRIVSRAYSEITQYFPVPGQVEHDAEEIWSVTIRAVGQALLAAGLRASDLSAIGITNQRETCLLWNRVTGRPVSRAIVWQDRRTADFCERLRGEGLSEPWRCKTGLVIDPYFSFTKLAWMLEHIPGVRESACAGDLAFGTIDTWLVWKLTGGRVHVTDYSNASRTMMFNIKELVWDKEILERLEIPWNVLPKVVSSSGIAGMTDPEVFSGASVPIAGIAGDQQAALFGQACFERGMVKNTYGTGSFLLMNTGAVPVMNSRSLLTTIAWRLGSGPVEYALEGSIFVTGAGVQWLRDGLGIIDDASETEALARSVDSNDNVYFVPALTGLGAPYWDPYARGLLVGLTRGTTRANIVRAALEAVCYQSRDVADAMVKESGIPVTCLKADGGAVGNTFLMQFQSDILGTPVEVPQVSETTALGAASLAGLAVGVWRDCGELARMRLVKSRYEPLMHREERDRLYRRWTGAVQLSRGWARG